MLLPLHHWQFSVHPLSFQGVSSFVPKVCKSELTSKSVILMDFQKSEVPWNLNSQPKASQKAPALTLQTSPKQISAKIPSNSSRRHATTGVWRDIQRLESNRPIRSSRKGWILLKASSVEVVCEWRDKGPMHPCTVCAYVHGSNKDCGNRFHCKKRCQHLDSKVHVDFLCSKPQRLNHQWSATNGDHQDVQGPVSGHAYWTP